MNVSLTPELETLIDKKVKSGMYNTASEVVREGLRLLEEQDQLRELRRAALQKEIIKGVEQIKNGEFTEVAVEDLEAFAKEISRRGRARLEAKKKANK
jgi:antitoxin ParD1/3/4